MSLPEVPTKENWNRIAKNSPFEKLIKQVRTLEIRDLSQGNPFDFLKTIEIEHLTMELDHRVVDAARSYILLMHFFEQGIPDEEWYISPGRNGESIEYFPQFEQKHHHIKSWFDYYVDFYYYKLFSAWNILAHIINITQKLNKKKNQVEFIRVFEALKGKNDSLYENLRAIIDDPVFTRANRIRNDITHNYAPHSVGLSVTIGERKGSLGVREYTKSAEIVSNAQSVAEVFAKTLEYLSVSKMEIIDDQTPKD